MTILIVEDDQLTRDNLQMVLRLQGYHTATAADGQQALHYLAVADPLPRLILLDLSMPVIDGWAFRKAQRANPAIAHIPVVLVSAEADLDQAKQELGAVAALSKPFNLVELLAVLVPYR